MNNQDPHSGDSHSEDHLTRALRQLGAASPRSAPPELGDRLARKFRQHHQRRRVQQWMAISAVTACLCVIVTVMVVKKPQVPIVGRQKAPTVTVPPSQATRILGQNDGFLALTVFDPGVETEDLRVMRVQMLGSALRLVGAPVSEELANQRITADLVVGQDGTPYAVRLVQ